MKKVPHCFVIAVSLLIVAAAPAPNFAQTPSGSSTPATNISNEYSYFLHNVDSKQVVNDLRNGQWTTTTTDPKTNVTTTTTEALPTGKMGFGNVKHSLALAQESLRQQGIMQPTSEQLHTALAGGQIVPGDPTLEQFSQRKETLPSGLQKKKDEDGTLTHGLDDGGKKLDPNSKGKKASKK